MKHKFKLNTLPVRLIAIMCSIKIIKIAISNGLKVWHSFYQQLTVFVECDEKEAFVYSFKCSL